MTAEQIITLVSSIASFLFVTLIPTIILLVNKWKAYNKAKTEEEKQQILNDISNSVGQLVTEAEEQYKDFDKVLKAQTGTGCGTLKKDKVLSQIQALCTEKGIEYDKEYWSNQVEEIVQITKQVNATITTTN